MSLTTIAFVGTVTVFILVAWSIYIVWRVGQIYLGSIFTMALGAYFSAYVTREWNWPFGLAIICSMGLGGLASFLLGLRLATVPPFTTAIVTIAMIFIGQTYVRSSAYLGMAAGFFHIPEITYLLPLTCFVLVVVGFFIYRVDRSRLGRAIDTVSVNPDLASSLGVDVPGLRLWCQTASGALGALAGVLYAFTIGAITPAAFGLPIVLSVFVFLFVGGSQTMWGPAVFAPILWAFAIFIPEEVGRYKDVIYGILLIAILILRPEGALDKKAVRAIRVGFVNLFHQRSGELGISKPRGQDVPAGVPDPSSETEDYTEKGGR